MSDFIQGLNTSVGQNFCKQVAHILNTEYTYSSTRKKKPSFKTLPQQENTFSQISSGWENGKAMKQIVGIISHIATRTFAEDFQFLRQGKNAEVNPARYKTLLDKWGLICEKQIFENRSKLLAPNLGRKLNGVVFTPDGKYKFDRAKALSDAIQKSK